MQVFLIAALTADGFIAKDPKEPSTNWTSKADKKWFNQKTREAGVVVMGRKTYETIDEAFRPLTGRANLVYSRNQKSEARNSKPTKGVPLGQIRNLKNLKNQTLVTYLNLDSQDLLDKLEQSGFKSVAICGGSSIYTMFVRSGLVDTLYLTVEENVKFGEGVRLFNDQFSMHKKQFGDQELKLIGFKYKLTKIYLLAEKTKVLEYHLISN